MSSVQDASPAATATTPLTYFVFYKIKFPDIVDSKIRTDDFIEASRGAAKLLELLGKVFAPARYDMLGNVDKLAKKFDENRSAYVHLEDILLAEQRVGENFATESLMWLRRGLHFMLEYYEAIVADESRQEDLGPLLMSAYGATLKKYHGFFSSQVFNLISKFVPYRSNMYKVLSTDGNAHEQEVLSDMAVFNSSLRPCIEHLYSFYIDNSLENYRKV